MAVDSYARVSASQRSVMQVSAENGAFPLQPSAMNCNGRLSSSNYLSAPIPFSKQECSNRNLQRLRVFHLPLASHRFESRIALLAN